MIVLGTAQFGGDYGITNVSGRPPKRKVFEMLESAWEQGVRRFDTAPDYGSEELLGEFAKVNGIQDELIALTKISPLSGRPDYQAEICRSIDSSQKKLNCNIDTLFLHDATDSELMLGDEAFFCNLLKTHQINHIGVSVYDPDEVRRLVESKLEPAFQFPFNVMDRRFGTVEMIPGKRYARSLFLQGLLVSVGPLPRDVESELVDLHRRYHEILNRSCTDALEFAISFATHSNCADYFVIGVNSVAQLQEVLTARVSNLADFGLVRSLVTGLPAGIVDPRTWNQPLVNKE